MKNHINFDGRKISPSKVVCVGRNYAEHIKELNNATPTEPVIFVKPNSAISSELVLQGSDEVHYEAELAFLVESGKLIAVGLGLDLTKRQIQHQLKIKGLPWERAKAFDQSAVFGAFVLIPDSVEDLHLALFINEQLQQKGGCSMMLFSPNELLNNISAFMTLEDGDILMTGTPAGVGKINAGDDFVGRVYSGEKLLVESTWSVSR
ncbi:fumarylacetoacetate hydrolase family protein [Marinicella litoralis]|uniref:2-keto-4-pentenoate hydratase/2-oxohepta-3-ene-1,7-dioic acid hydratase in catechol pathway n=1 Tax=Marinicella litoralis TaxID=644220 RepID=A0A4R6XN58_9GAMM|nr:fumarylacetoacetate hydrolase family protein [Marinicella litoralis]TDR19374.1 2-keto-4-pentenoate hydratase/2-oxohepta-3-ene-1,7-dioic acid hydratase in catechol pathway [Marinicella litoralis]